MKLPVATLFAYSVINLAACSGSSSDLTYLNSRVFPDLEVPPDLTIEEADSNFRLPAVFSGDGKGSGNSVPVLANVDSIKLEGHADFYWLSVDEPVGNLYQLVKDFWASEGFTLAMDEPVIGIMKTDWDFSEEGKGNEDKGFFARLFSSDDLSPSQDQFKTRIARGPEKATSEIYISHRGTEYKHVMSNQQGQQYARVHLTDFEEEDDWTFRASEPELEVEMLSRLMIYLGLRKVEVDGKFSNIKLFSPRATIHTNFSGNDTADEIYILVKDVYKRTWYRTLHQLDRLNFKIISADISSGISKKGVIRVETDIEVENTGIFSIFFDKEIVKKQVELVFSEETHEITRIDMEASTGETEFSPEEEGFLTLLYQYLK